MKQINFYGKLSNPPPLLLLFFFDNRKIVKHKKIPLGVASALWDTEVSTENCDRRPSLITLKFFDTKKFLKHRSVALRYVVAMWDKNNVDGKSCCPLPLLSLILSDSMFGPLRHKFLTEKGDTRPSSFLKSSRYQNVLGRQAGSSTRSFGTVTDEKQSTKNCASPLFYQWKVSIPKTIWNTEGFV